MSKSSLWRSPGTGSLHARSVARTWLATGIGSGIPGLGEQCVAGKVCSVVLRVGQPIWPAQLVLQLVPVHPKGKGPALSSRPQHADEQLIRTVSLHQALHKGQMLPVRFGPCCVAGPHLLCITLNGSHVGASPMEVTVHAAEVQAAACTVHGLSRKLRRSCAGMAGAPIHFDVVLRDEYGNASDADTALGVAVARGLSVALSLRPGCAVDWVPPGDAEAERPEEVQSCAVGVAVKRRGALTVAVVLRRAGVYEAGLRLYGKAVSESMEVHAEPAEACAGASTVHGAPPHPAPPPPFLSSWRAIAGARSVLLLSAGDALGNQRRASPGNWRVRLEAGEGEGEGGAAEPLEAVVESGSWGEGEEGGGDACVMRYTAGRPGLTSAQPTRLHAAFNNVPARGSPIELLLLPPAFGCGLHLGTAGQVCRFWVYLSTGVSLRPPTHTSGLSRPHPTANLPVALSYA